MKFVTELIGKLGARFGHIHIENNHCTNDVLDTPFCFVYTRAGCIPHLTKEVFQMVTKNFIPVQLSLDTIINCNDAVKEYRKGIGQFLGFEKSLIFMSLQDPSVNKLTGFNTTTSTSVWNQTGRVQLNVKKFMALQDAFSADWFQALCDSDTNYHSSKKRIKKSVDRTLQHLDECIIQCSNLKNLKNSKIFGTIEGGYDMEERIRSAKETSLRPVAGFIIEGLSTSETLNENAVFDETLNIVKEILKVLPDDKPRIMHGVWRPDEIMDFIEHGIDIFDMTYVHYVTEKGIALNFCLNFNNISETKLPSNILENVRADDFFGMDLNEKQFAKDFSAVVDNCTCYTCRKHSRSYIHHLLTTSEMLANVLIMMHNMHHYVKFFEAIHESLKLNKFESLKVAIAKN